MRGAPAPFLPAADAAVRGSPSPPGAAQPVQPHIPVPASHRLGSCRLTGACCRALAAGIPPLTCLDLSDNELGADGVLQLCRQLRSPSCPLRALG